MWLWLEVVVKSRHDPKLHDSKESGIFDSNKKRLQNADLFLAATFFSASTMTRLATVAAVGAALFSTPALAFTCPSVPVKRRGSTTSLQASRRSFFSQALVTSAACVAACTAFVPPALAIPSVTISEFEKILKDSARSVEVVEFAGPKSDIVTVRLTDGTTFGISDIVESPTDPRSPLKLVATLRGYKVPCKFMTLENALSGSTTTKKKKSYANERVQLAAEKEREKAERMAQDEAERQAELSRMEQEKTK